MADDPAPGAPYTRSVEIKRGGTLMGALVDAGAERPDAHAAIKAVREHIDLRRLMPGQEVRVAFAPAHADSLEEVDRMRLLLVAMRPNPGREILAVRNDDDGFVATEDKVRTHAEMAFAQGTVETSLYGAARGVPTEVVAQMVGMFSFDVDFQRDLQPGDSFKLVYENHVDSDGNFVRLGAVVYGEMTLSGDRIQLYRHPSERMATGFEYFDAEGRSAVKALMRTPINGARLSSGYGMRKHPILGYSKMHKGVDFAAPTGTKIMAAGSGVVDKIGMNGAYGHYIRIRHNETYATAYAHLSRYAKGLKRGDRVKQGEIIGYVGSTGRSTGPHLHYEVLVNGRAVDPRSVDLPTARQLEGRALQEFLAARTQMDTLITFLSTSNEVAAR